MSASLNETVGEAIQLFTKQQPDGQVDSVIPIRWCISPKVAEMIKQNTIENPQMLLVIENDGQETDRYIVPLMNEMRYVQFRRPGTNIVHATIVWRGNSDPKKVLEKSDNGLYRTESLESRQPGAEKLYRLLSECDPDDAEEYDRRHAEYWEARDSEPSQILIRQFDSINRLKYEAELAVEVPREMFADPPAWMEWLATRYWKRKSRDQCQMRRRAIATAVSFIVVLPITAIVLAIAEFFNILVMTVLLLFGMRKLSSAPLTRPWAHWPNEAWKEMASSFWWTKLFEKANPNDYYSRDLYVPRHPVFFLVNPPVIVGCTAAGLALMLYFGSVIFLVLGLVAAFVLGLTVLAIGYLARGPIARYRDELYEKRRLADEKEREAFRNKLRGEIDSLTCNIASRNANLSALPKQRQTVYLRYQDFKSKVCKPFAK